MIERRSFIEFIASLAFLKNAKGEPSSSGSSSSPSTSSPSSSGPPVISSTETTEEAKEVVAWDD